MAARFHNGLADGVVAACRRVREATGLGVVALSGGVFQNVVLTERVVAGLGAGGFRVLTHSRVPPNDGGISLGQAVVAGARDRAEPETRGPRVRTFSRAGDLAVRGASVMRGRAGPWVASGLRFVPTFRPWRIAPLPH